MKATRIAIIIVAVIILFFALPVFSFSATNSSYFGSTKTNWSADVSLSFLLFHCGVVLNPTVTTAVLGYQVGQSIAPTGFYCNISPNQ